MYYTAVFYAFSLVASCFYSLPLWLAAPASFALFVCVLVIIWSTYGIVQAAGFMVLPDEQVERLLFASASAETDDEASSSERSLLIPSERGT